MYLLHNEKDHYLQIFLGAELAMFVEPLNPHCKDTIIIPVNSNQNPRVTGGIHWLVLQYLPCI
jgi:hypothetical protein